MESMVLKTLPFNQKVWNFVNSLDEDKLNCRLKPKAESALDVMQQMEIDKPKSFVVFNIVFRLFYIGAFVSLYYCVY